MYSETWKDSKDCILLGHLSGSSGGRKHFRNADMLRDIILELWRQRQEDHHKFEVSLIYIVSSSPIRATW